MPILNFERLLSQQYRVPEVSLKCVREEHVSLPFAC